MSEPNRMYFSKEDVENGQMIEFVKFLTSMCYESDRYNDIHITPADCGAFDVEWVQVDWDNNWGEFECFEFVGEGQEVCTCLHYPDDHFEFTPNPEEDLKEWLKENPGWEKDEYGRWQNEES